MSWVTLFDAIERGIKYVSSCMLRGFGSDWDDDATSRAESRSKTTYTTTGTGLWTGISKAPGRRGQVDAWCVRKGCAYERQRVGFWHVHEPVYPHHEKSE